jgi:hypothetical protein
MHYGHFARKPKHVGVVSVQYITIWPTNVLQKWVCPNVTKAFKFCIALLVVSDAFQKCNVVSNYLQTSSIDFLAAVTAIDNLRATLRSCRTDESYANYEKQVADLLLKVNVVRSVPTEERLNSDHTAPMQKGQGDYHRNCAMGNLFCRTIWPFKFHLLVLQIVLRLT